MPQSDRVTELPLQEVERPECPLCKTGMWLMHIVPEEPARPTHFHMSGL